MNLRFLSMIFINVIITMILIVIVKKVSKQYNVPFMKTLAEEV